MIVQRMPANLVASADLSISKTDGKVSGHTGQQYHLYYRGQ